jgi:hypothetical protein
MGDWFLHVKYVVMKISELLLRYTSVGCHLFGGLFAINVHGCQMKYYSTTYTTFYFFDSSVATGIGCAAGNCAAVFCC